MVTIIFLEHALTLEFDLNYGPGREGGGGVYPSACVPPLHPAPLLTIQNHLGKRRGARLYVQNRPPVSHTHTHTHTHCLIRDISHLKNMEHTQKIAKLILIRCCVFSVQTWMFENV